MNKEIWLGKKNLRFHYYRYKDSPYYPLAVSAIVIIVCLVLLVNVVIPQFSNWFSIRKEVQATQERISTLKRNINFMNNVDKGVLNAQFETASRALPPERDLEGILNALSDAAIISGVSFDDFNFQLGSLDGASAKKAAATKDLYTIQISLVIHGPLEKVKRFLQEIAVKVPLSDVSYINGSGDVVALHIRFYQKPFPKVTLKEDDPLAGISDNKQELLRKLASWKAGQRQLFIPSPEASTAGIPLF